MHAVQRDLNNIRSLKVTSDIDIGNYTMSMGNLALPHIASGLIPIVGVQGAFTSFPLLSYSKGILNSPALKVGKLLGDLDVRGHIIHNAQISSSGISNCSVSANTVGIPSIADKHKTGFALVDKSGDIKNSATKTDEFLNINGPIILGELGKIYHNQIPAPAGDDFINLVMDSEGRIHLDPYWVPKKVLNETELEKGVEGEVGITGDFSNKNTVLTNIEVLESAIIGKLEVKGETVMSSVSVTGVTAKTLSVEKLTVTDVNTDSMRVSGQLLLDKGLKAQFFEAKSGVLSKSVISSPTVAVDVLGPRSMVSISPDDFEVDILDGMPVRDESNKNKLIIQKAFLNDPVIVGGTIKGKVAIDSISSISVDGPASFNDDTSIGGTLTVHGAVMGSGPYIDSSDERFKKDINKLEGALGMVCNMTGYTFKYKTEEFPERQFDDRLQIGWMAGELSETIPEIVYKDSEGFYHVAYGRATTIVAEAVKELHIQVDAQSEEIRELKKQNEYLKKEMSELKSLISKIIR